jgi:hypothetical protein
VIVSPSATVTTVSTCSLSGNLVIATGVVVEDALKTILESTKRLIVSIVNVTVSLNIIFSSSLIRNTFSFFLFEIVVSTDRLDF